MELTYQKASNIFSLIVMNSINQTMNNPVVSIVTPSYNQGQFIEETIKSVLSQDYPHIEYMVIDGGSSDNSVAIIKRYESKIAYWVSEKDKGQGNAINKGWEKATGEILAFINSDDMLAPGAVSRIVSVFQQNKKIGIIYGDCAEIDEKNDRISFWKSRKTNLKDSIWNGQAFAQPSAFFNAKLVKSVGMINENLHLALDYDLILAIMKTAPVYYLPETLAQARIYRNTKTNTLIERHWRESLRVRWKYGKLFIVKPVIEYLMYRLLHSMPKGLQMQFRKIRRSSVDKLYLSGKLQ
jgi:glycosyltransferase involved in cell wall biosynthesis